MMLFSAIGVMVIYLNVPTTTTPGLDVTTNVVTEPTTITIPTVDAPSEEVPTPDGSAPAEAWGETVPTAETAPTAEVVPTEEVIAEPAPAQE